MVYVEYYGDLRSIIGKSEDTFEADNLADLINLIGKEYGKTAKKSAKSSLIVADNEKIFSIRKTKLHEFSKVGFFPMCCGG